VVTFTHILAPVDFSDFASRSLAHAAALSRWYDAKLSVLHVAPAFEVLPVEGALGVPLQDVRSSTQEEAVQDMRRLLEAGGVADNAVPVTRTGDPSAVIIEEAVKNKTDLIVMGTHGRRGFRRMLLGSVTESVLREAPCPVLTVPPRAASAPPDAVTFKRILCATDFSPSALLALRFALDLARQADGAVTLLHSIEFLAEEEPRMVAQFDVLAFRQRLQEEAKMRLEELVAAESRTWASIETEVVIGRPYREVLKAADARQSDLIVMGAQGRGGIGLALFGSTTQQVVRGASCPVLTVREAAKV
jgi:nucleotide-binding universal stress UspA family protein